MIDYSSQDILGNILIHHQLVEVPAISTWLLDHLRVQLVPSGLLSPPRQLLAFQTIGQTACLGTPPPPISL